MEREKVGGVWCGRVGYNVDERDGWVQKQELSIGKTHKI